MIKNTKKNIFFIGAFMAIAAIPTLLFGAIQPTWKIPFKNILPAHEGTIHSEFTPALLNNKIILGTNQGYIKSIDLETKKATNITLLPIEIHKVEAFGQFSILVSGPHLQTRQPYYAVVQIPKKRIMGVLSHNGPLWRFDDWAIYEKNNIFYVFDAKNGRTIYGQKTETNMRYPVETQNKRRTVFFNSKNELVQLKLPTFGAGLLLSQHNKSDIVKFDKPVIQFEVLATLPADFMPDTLIKNTLYYHKKNGAIGKYNIKKAKTLWEKSFFASDMDILGPHAYLGNLIYLVSYPKSRIEKLNIGKIISLKDRNGALNWLSKDQQFRAFSPIRFKQLLISGDTEQHVVLFNIFSGKPKATFMIDGIITKPLCEKNTFFIKTDATLYRFDNNLIPKSTKATEDTEE